MKESLGLWCPLSSLSSSLCLWLWKGSKFARPLGKGWVKNAAAPRLFYSKCFWILRRAWVSEQAAHRPGRQVLDWGLWYSSKPGLSGLTPPGFSCLDRAQAAGAPEAVGGWGEFGGPRCVHACTRTYMCLCLSEVVASGAFWDRGFTNLLCGIYLPPYPPPSGLVQESPGQMEKAGAEPAGRAVQEWLWAAVQRPYAALRRHVPGLFLQQLGRQGSHVSLSVHQELPFLQLYERQPPVITEHVLPTQFHLLHEHVVQHGALSCDRRPGLQPQ